jgi:uncharacterized protein (AIM24 family)
MVNHEIIGDDMQAVILTLAGGDAVRAEAGAMRFMTDAIEVPVASGSRPCRSPGSRIESTPRSGAIRKT